MVQLETNVDDVTGEVLGNLIELLMEAGALDVSIVPAVMKKGRPGNVITVIAQTGRHRRSHPVDNAGDWIPGRQGLSKRTPQCGEEGVEDGDCGDQRLPLPGLR